MKQPKFSLNRQPSLRAQCPLYFPEKRTKKKTTSPLRNYSNNTNKFPLIQPHRHPPPTPARATIDGARSKQRKTAACRACATPKPPGGAQFKMFTRAPRAAALRRTRAPAPS